MVSGVKSQRVAVDPLSTMEGEYRRNRLILGGIAAVFGGVSVATNAGDAFAGDIPSLCRLALGVVGLLAAVMLQMRPALGWRLGWLWALVQIPAFAWTPGGNPTVQMLDLTLSFSHKVTTNGAVTSYTMFGINVMGIILFAIFHTLRAQASWHKD
jgi:hypothetical protein